MAKETKKPAPAETEATEETPGSTKKKKLMLFGGGGIGLVAAAFVAALAATPAKKEYKVFEGPFVSVLCADKLTVNLEGEGRKRFLIFKFEALFDAYEKAYVEQRVISPIYLSLMKDVALKVSARRNADEVNSDVGNAAFREELRQSIEPLLFPVQLGKTALQSDLEPNSGLKMGLSGLRSNYRGHLYDGKLILDVPAGTVRFNRGQPVRFEGHEKDLRVEDENGRFVHLDVSRCKPDFAGEVMVGVHGRIREILLTDWNVQ